MLPPPTCSVCRLSVLPLTSPCPRCGADLAELLALYEATARLREVAAGGASDAHHTGALAMLYLLLWPKAL